MTDASYVNRGTRLVALTLAVGLVLVNVVAFMQARAMTRFTTGGVRTAPPEALGPLETAGVLLTGVRIPRPANATTPASFGVAYETVRIPRAPDVTLEAWLVPANPRRPLVLAFHGYAVSKASLLPVARLLNQLGYDVLLVDFHGSGGSSGSGTSLGFDEARDVAAALTYARKRWPDRGMVLYGSSMGGAAMLRGIAKEGARPDAVIAEATFDTLLHTTRNRFRAMGLPPTPLAELLLFWGGIQNGVDCFAMSPARDARSVACPSIVLHAGSDERVRLTEARRLASSFRPPARLHVYPGVPHTLIAGARPVEWTRDVGAFLAMVPSTRSRLTPSR